MERVRSESLAVGIDHAVDLRSTSGFRLDELQTRSTALAAVLAPFPLDQRLQRMRREVPAASSSPRASASRTRLILHATARSTRSTSRSSRSIPAGCFRRPTTSGRRPSAATASASAAFHPQRRRVEALVARRKGINGFCHSIEARQACCGVPQGRAARPRARRRRGLDHRPAGRPVGRRAATSRLASVDAGPRRSSSSIRCSTGRASRSPLRARPRRPVQRAA